MVTFRPSLALVDLAVILTRSSDRNLVALFVFSTIVVFFRASFHIIRIKGGSCRGSDGTGAAFDVSPGNWPANFPVALFISV